MILIVTNIKTAQNMQELEMTICFFGLYAFQVRLRQIFLRAECAPKMHPNVANHNHLCAIFRAARVKLFSFRSEIQADTSEYQHILIFL